ncbi:MAG: hypothetical protein ACRC0A_04870 [Chitinophagaceae bacterium]
MVSVIHISFCPLFQIGGFVRERLTTTNVPESRLNRAMMNTVQKVIVLADSSKFKKKGFIKICDLYRVDEIITDDKISSHVKKAFLAKGIQIKFLTMLKINN